MTKTTLRSAALLAAFVAGSAAAAPSGTLALRDAGTIKWICGGVGADERRALARSAPGANLEILFVSAKRGAYLAGADLAIFGKGVAAPLLEVASTGPVCLVHAPPGEYRLKARLEGVARERTVRVAATGRAAARAVLAFPDEPWDGIRASEEEKRQAREP